MKLGIVGAGFFGQLAHIANYHEIEDCHIVAIASGRPLLRQKVADRYNIPRTYASHHELLADPEVEAIIAVTGRPQTGPVALDCLTAGKPLLTEKPMASTVEQAEKLANIARSKKLTYTVGYMKRYDQGVQNAKSILDELVKTGELGPILYTRAHCFAGDAYQKADGHVVTSEKKTKNWKTWGIAPDWVPDKQKQQYHQFLNAYCHNINLLRYLHGKTPSVSHVEFDKPGCKVAILDFGNHLAILETGQFSYRGWDEITEIYFTEGRLQIKTPPPLLKNVPAKIELYKGGSAQQTFIPHADWSWAFRRQAEAFISDVKNNKASLSSGADSIEDIRLVEEMWKMKIENRPTLL